MSAQSSAQNQFVALLREMFQIQDLDLDFGIYRVLNQEKKLIQDFLDTRLGPIVREALGSADDTQRAAIESEMAKLAQTLTDAGVNPESAPKYVELKQQLDALGSSQSLETEVYNGLYDFFGRYYDKGDFLSRPRYKKDVYALPYNGKEVKLHWANRDQYYIKSAQVLEAFDWTLNGQKVRFQIREAGVAENNTKEERKFVLALDENEGPVVGEENGVLTVWFDFKKTSGGPRDLNADAEKKLSEWNEGRELVAPLLAPFNEKKSHFLHRLNSWTARRDFDFFVHKDLRGFLARELDFYLKNEVVRLDDLLAGDASTWEKTTLAKARAMHALGGKIIDFLASLEELQKRLWEKQKWVTQSRAIVPLQLIPESLQSEVLNNAAQIEEWKTLYGVESEPVSTLNPVQWSEPPSANWADHHGDIAVDTMHFDTAFARRLWSQLSCKYLLDDVWNGVLWNGDNFAALNLMKTRFRDSVKCIYIDPPYNAKSSEILYKNSYKHSSWLTMMQDRLEVSRLLVDKDGCLIIAIDENEQARLDILLEENFADYQRTCISVVHNPAGVQGTNFSYTHEYAYFVFPSSGTSIGSTERETDLVSSLRDWGGTSSRNLAKNCFYPIIVKDEEIVGFGDVCADDFHPAAANVEEDGFVYIYPIDSNGDEKKWVFSRNSVEKNQEQLFLRVQADEIAVMRSKALRKYRTVWDDKRYYANIYGSKLLTSLFGNQPFSFPKSIHTVEDSIKAITSVENNGLILDYFAGSGTTGHAIINLNRADGENGRRKYLLVEQGRYFDSVLVPRLKKAAFADKWRDGRPAEFSARNGVPQTLLCYRLESYEDALEHLAAVVKENGQLQIASPDDDFTVRYALSTQTRDGELPLADTLFQAPFDIQMRVGGNDVNEAQTITPDAIATFNWLLGLRVHKMWFASEKLGAVCGLLPDDRAAVIVWRHLEGETYESADTALRDFWVNDTILSNWRETHAPDVVYVNGDSTLGALKTAEEVWEVASLEAEFRRLMFATSPQTPEVF